MDSELLCDDLWFVCWLLLFLVICEFVCGLYVRLCVSVVVCCLLLSGLCFMDLLYLCACLLFLFNVFVNFVCGLLSAAARFVFLCVLFVVCVYVCLAMLKCVGVLGF